MDIGSRSIKEQRRKRVVPCEPRGVVVDYVPFYFGPRSPMMFAIAHGRVPEYAEGSDPLVHLVTTVEELRGRSIGMVFTDGNAASAYSVLRNRESELEDLVDWDLMTKRYWADTPGDPDRRRRRMAECLAAGPVPFSAFHAVAVRTEDRAREVGGIRRSIGAAIHVRIEPGWYF